MKADTHPTGSTAVATNPPTDYLKPVLTSANAGLSVPGGPPPPGPELALNVECGPNKAWFYVGRLCQGSKGPCVLFNGAWLTPNEFQYVSGRETAKDWKRSIRHHGKSMKLLMTKGILAIAPPSCQCDVCTGCAENNNNLDVNKRAAEIAARKAAAEAAAAAEGAGKTPTINERTSDMADSTLIAAEDRLADADAGNDLNSPAKESRLTNIIEAIKSKKKKDPADGTSDSAQKENRPNSRPSSRSGKKKKEQVSENGVGSPDDSSTQHSPGIDVSTSLPTSTLDIMQVSRPDVTLYPAVSVAATVDAPLPAAPTEVTSDPAAAMEVDGEESDAEPTEEVDSDDVSRTRPYDWSTRKGKKVPDMAQIETVQGAASLEQVASRSDHNSNGSSSSSSSCSHSPSMAATLPSLASRDLSGQKEAGSSDGPLSPGRRTSPLQSQFGRWSPSAQAPQLPHKVVSGQDTKPPLLSSSRSITTATTSITKPIVSTGTAMFTSCLPKEQRDNNNSSKDGREESAKVYAPINWPPVASEINSEVKATAEVKVSTNCESRATSESSSAPKTSSESSSASSRLVGESRPTTDRHATPEKEKSSDDRGRPSPPTPKVAAKATELTASSNYSEYLRHLGRVPGAPPPGMDDESYIAMMRRYYEWYEMSRLYGPYGLTPGGHPTPSTPALPRSAIPTHPGAYDPHSLLSMYHPYYYPHPATAGDPYRALGATAIPQDWARLSALSEHEREVLLARQRGEDAVAKESAGSQGLKRAYPGEMSREEALDLSVNKKQKLAESLAARDSAALLYGLHASGFRSPQFAAMGAPGAAAAGYPAGVGSLELAAAYPGLWGLPHSHPGASLSHAIPTTCATMQHPGLAYMAHPLAAVAAVSRPNTTTSTATSSAASPIHKDLLHAAHRSEAQSLGLAGAWR